MQPAEDCANGDCGLCYSLTTRQYVCTVCYMLCLIIFQQSGNTPLDRTWTVAGAGLQHVASVQWARCVRSCVHLCVLAIASRDSHQFNIILSYGLFFNYCILVTVVVERGYIIMFSEDAARARPYRRRSREASLRRGGDCNTQSVADGQNSSDQFICSRLRWARRRRRQHTLPEPISVATTNGGYLP